MKKLIVIAAFVLLGMLANSAQATLFTGCISPGGDLRNVAEGEEPLKKCGKNDTLTQWETPEEEPEPVTICPCDFQSTVHWANWLDLGCLLFPTSDEDRLILRSVNSGNGRPLVQVSISDAGISSCYALSFDGGSLSADDISDDELLACEADLDDLAIKLGRLSGCTW
jgi:hypothetical protein